MWHLRDIQPGKHNCFFYWDGSKLDGERLSQAIDSIWSTIHFNPDRKIWLISNTEAPEDWPNVRVTKWDDSIYSDMPNAEEWAKIYNTAHPRDRSDLIRLLLLYKYGGSYIDTDDICLRAMPPLEKENIVSRSYDPHTCHYDGWKPEDCIPGWTRGETSEFQHIPWFPRNDCWYNWQPKHELIFSVIKAGAEKPEAGINSIYTAGRTGKLSWQSLILIELKNRLHEWGKTWQSALTLIYLPESHVSACSHWDKGHYGGELHSIWPKSEQPWGQQEFSSLEADTWLATALDRWPLASHLWLHDKGARVSPQWHLRAPHKTTELMSTHIIRKIRAQIGRR